MIAATAIGLSADRSFAQNRPDTIQGVADTIPREAAVPRGALIRSLILPGWGQFYVGAPRRGAFFVAIQGASYYMLVKTIGKLNDIKDEERVLAQRGRDSLQAAMALDTALARRLSDPLLFEDALADYPGLEGARALVTSRERHRQDWIVYTVFFTFASGVDAYVTAHMKDFPVGITTTRRSDGGVGLNLRLNVGTRRR